MNDTTSTKDGKVVEFPKAPGSDESDFERKWGTKVAAFGYTILPSVLVHAQRRLGLTPLQFNIVIQLLDYWWRPGDKPRPAKIQIADRIGIHPRTVAKNIRELEKAGLIKRIGRRTIFGDWHANEYDFSGLIAKLKVIEPELANARQEKRQARATAETPKGRRGRS